MNAGELIKTIWPLIAIQFAMQIYAIVDIAIRKKTRNLNMATWIIIVIIGEILGPIAYLIFGRSEE